MWKTGLPCTVVQAPTRLMSERPGVLLTGKCMTEEDFVITLCYDGDCETPGGRWVHKF